MGKDLLLDTMEEEGMKRNEENVEDTVVWPRKESVAQVIGPYKVCITNTCTCIHAQLHVHVL